MAIEVRRHEDVLNPDRERVVLRPFRLTDPEGEKHDGRTARIIDRVLSLGPEERKAELHELARLEARHSGVGAKLDRRFVELVPDPSERPTLEKDQARLIAAFFSEEFAIEAAALFNPSVVPHFDQSGLGDGDVRFIMSLRGIGEGHISSLIFQSGIWRGDGGVALDPRSPRATGPDVRLPIAGAGEREAVLDFPNIPIGERVIYPFLPSQGAALRMPVCLGSSRKTAQLATAARSPRSTASKLAGGRAYR